MSMLAEPRKRYKWMINPRGTDWANDDNKFGQKLMEKMGWSKGRGLGREEQGNVDHISVQVKNNTRGIGFKVTDDQWIQHYEGFESVLAGLNNQNSTTESPESSDSEKHANHSSLEALSKTSQARLHYHKFTRGKDLSRLNADDIGCITGSKRAKRLAEVKKDDDFQEDEVGHTQHSSGLTTIKGGNYQDYFAKKRAALKFQTVLNLNDPASSLNDVCDNPLSLNTITDNEQLASKTNKKSKKKKRDCFEEVMNGISSDKNDVQLNCSPLDNEQYSPEVDQFAQFESKRYSKKKKTSFENDKEKVENLEYCDMINKENNRVEKIDKIYIRKGELNECTVNKDNVSLEGTLDRNHSESESSSKKAKKKKNKEEYQVGHGTANHKKVPQQKAKWDKKKKEERDLENVIAPLNNVEELKNLENRVSRDCTLLNSVEGPLKKKKKKESRETEEEISLSVPDELAKKNKKKKEDLVEGTHPFHSEEGLPKKKKKKNRL